MQLLTAQALHTSDETRNDYSVLTKNEKISIYGQHFDNSQRNELSISLLDISINF